MARVECLASFALILIGPVVCALAGGATSPHAKVGEAEEKTLQALNLKADNESLLSFLRARTIKDEDYPVFAKLIADLDSEKYTIRVQASKELKQRGRTALPLLRKALKDAPLEVVLRASECIKEIEAKTSSEPIAVVARLLALRDVPAAAGVLFAFLPSVDDPFVEEEVLAALGQLTVRGDKINPELAAALKHPAAQRRGPAAYILAQRGDPAQRDTIRQLLDDRDAEVRTRVAAGLLGKRLLQLSQETQTADLALLAEAKVDLQGPGLLQFLGKRTPSEAEQKRLEQCVLELGHKNYNQREKATKALLGEGAPALPFLRIALDSSDLEIVTRARQCIKTIKTNTSPGVPMAVVRVLGLAGVGQRQNHGASSAGNDPRVLKPADVIPVLLGYIPFADDDSVEDEIIHSLLVLSTREAAIHPALVAAMTDALPARRAAAAVVLGKVGSRQNVETVKGLLKDNVALVKFRAAQGLLAAHDKDAVQTLIDLLGTAPDGWLWQVDGELARLAVASPPLIPATDTTAEFRVKAGAAWNGWWKTNAKSVDFANLRRGEALLGIITITEYDTQEPNQPNRNGRVWECGRDGKPRWELTNLQGAMDSHVLPNGRMLVSEANANKVTERDKQGNITWTYQTSGPPVAVQRLANGNTFLCTYDRVLEVTPGGQVIYSVTKPGQMFGAQRLNSGHVAVITANGQVIVFDPVANRDIKTINLGVNGGWCGIDVLPNGHYLVSLQSINQIREIDNSGKIHWQINFPNVFRAIKLPNGNVLACSMTTRRVAELDRNGNEVWGVTCKGRPFSVKIR